MRQHIVMSSASSLMEQLAGYEVRKLSLMSIVSGICDMPKVVGVDKLPCLKIIFTDFFYCRECTV